MVKKWKKTVTVICMLCTFSITGLAEPLSGYSLSLTATDEVSSVAEAEEKQICQNTVEDDFDGDMVMVTQTKAATVINKVYPAEHFGNLPIAYIEDLSAITNDAALQRIDKENYHQILALHLNVNDKAAVLSTIRELEKRPDILSARPNVHFQVKSSMPAPASSDSRVTMRKAAAAQADSGITTGVMPNDTQMQRQEWTIKLLQLNDAWMMSKGSANIKVGVVDSGIDITHPDLTANCNRSLGKDFTNDGYGAWSDPARHGTAVAGIIGAVGNNGVGITGVCWQVQLVSLRVLDANNKGDYRWVAQAVNYANNIGLDILNLSAGDTTNDNNQPKDKEKQALQNFAGVVVCAAGNTESGGVEIGRNVPYYPACYNLSNMITAGSSTIHDTLAPYSNYGGVVNLMAPGDTVFTTYGRNGYTAVNGTSFAAPYVTGVAALIKSYNPALTTSQIKSCIMKGVDYVYDFSDKCLTGGRLNAHNALLYAREVSINPYTTVCGDFDGDSYDEYAAFCGTGSHVDVVMWDDKSSGDLGRTIITSDHYTPSRVIGRVVAGDFDGNHVDEIAALYDYGSFIKIWIFYKRPDGSYSSRVLGQTGSFEAANITNRVAAGDFDGDGRNEIGAFYAYGNDTYMKMWIFEQNTDGSFNHYAFGQANNYIPSKITGRVAAGDFDGDGVDEMTALYDCGNIMKMWIFERTTAGTYHQYYVGPCNNWNANNITGRVTAGDFDNDGVDELATVYDNGDLNRLWLFKRKTDGTFYYGILGESSAFDAELLRGRLFTGRFIHGVDEIGMLLPCEWCQQLWVAGKTPQHGFYWKAI